MRVVNSSGGEHGLENRWQGNLWGSTPQPPALFFHIMLRTGHHSYAVAEQCAKKYGWGVEFFLGLYHDALEEKLFTAGEIREDFIKETEVFPNVVSRVDELMEALTAITRKSSETYFEYISRCGKNDLARRVKIVDLMENRFNRGECPGDLSKRYDKALKMLSEDK